MLTQWHGARTIDTELFLHDTNGITMKLESRISNNTRFITLSGDFDAEGAASTREKIESLCDCESITQIDIDMGQVGFLDSSGIGALVYLFKRLKAAGCQMSLSSVRGQPAELMKLLRVNQAITVYWDDASPQQGLAV